MNSCDVIAGPYLLSVTSAVCRLRNSLALFREKKFDEKISRQVMIPLPMYVAIEITKLCQIYFIQNDLEVYHKLTDKPLECRALNITEDLGQIQYVFSDKTGTLTENRMVFQCCTIGGVDYSKNEGMYG